MEPGLDLMDVKEQSGTSSINIASGFRQLNVKTEPGKEQFPAGMRVLVVDDDPMCLMILEKMLRKCSYHVTACAKATTALAMLRENKTNFDLVISDVYMPDMDGFKLLELVGLEMDLPVIMMSTDGETSAVMKGITHGACDYLLKPVRMEELRNIWQHVVRKRQNEASATLQCDRSGSPEENERHKRSFDEGEHTSSLSSKKRKEGKDEDDDENEHEDPLTLKKPRVVWSVELHQQFVTAVNQLGIDKAVPKRILELMNVQGLTRENVASHLQKYRLYLKRLSVQHSQNGTNMAFNTTSESSYGAMNSLDLMNDLTPLSPNVQLPFATMNSGMTGRLDLAGTLASNAVDSPVFLQYGAVQARPIGRPHIASQLINNNQGLGTSVSFLPGMNTEILPQNKQLPSRQSIEDASVTNSVQLHLPQVGRALNPSPSREINNAALETNGNPLMLLHQQSIQCNRQQNRPTDEASPSAGPTACLNGYSDLATSAQFVPSSLGRKVPILSSASSSAASLVRETDNHFFSVVGSNFTALNGSGVPPVIISSEGRNDIFGDSIANRNSSLSDKSCFASAGKSTSDALLVSNQGGRMGWQTNDLGKVSIASFIPRYNKVSSGAQVYNAMSGSGHASGHELLDQGPNFQRKFNGSLFQTLENVQCNSEQSMAESDFRVKPEPILDSPGSGVRNSFQVQKVASSDDLFSIFFRQQQKEPMLAENDLR